MLLKLIYIGFLFLQINHHLHYSPFHAKGLTIIRCTGQQVQKKLLKLEKKPVICKKTLSLFKVENVQVK